MKFRYLAAMATLGTGLAQTAAAETVTLDVLHCNASFSRFHQPIADAFMAENPDIHINFLAPCADYDAGHQQMLRFAVTNNLPDLYFSGFHLLEELTQSLAERGQIQDLQPYLDELGETFIAENYDPNILALGHVNGSQYGLPVNASSPIMYYNIEMVREAGGDPDNMPDNFDDLIELAARIDALGDDISGLSYDVHGWSDDWLWQALLYQQGGSLLNAERDGAGFDNEFGLNALTLTQRFATEAGMEVIDPDQSRQQFGAGLTGIIFDTPARLQTLNGLVGERFELGTTTFPLNDKEQGGVPTGGNAVVVTSQDETQLEAARKYALFVTGPEAQAIAVKITGYLPTNQLALGDNYLAPYYEANPNAATATQQADRSLPWIGYPGGESVRIWRTQRDIISQVMRGEVTPEEGLDRIVSETNALIR
ncbi:MULTISPECIES: ABC transporter substrate-binding protein [unclassified Halomonas]|uniref:ABC transporter substrate-binding protein n=1 Tax=unclassified Halomonas TaxID=2609666 RepID=UPI004034F0D4